MSVTYDSCSNDETSCWITAYVNDAMIEGDCYADDLFRNNDTSGNDTDCVQYEDGDCTEDGALQIEGMTYCWYYNEYNACNDSSSCFVTVTINGVDDEGDCGEIQQKYGYVPPESSGDDQDDCILTHEETCMDNASFVDGLEQCTVFITTNICDDTEICWVEANVHG